MKNLRRLKIWRIIPYLSLFVKIHIGLRSPFCYGVAITQLNTYELKINI